MLDKYLTPEEVAKYLSVTDRTVYTWLRTNQLKGVKLGRLWRIKEKDLENFLNENSNPSRVEPVTPHNDGLTRKERREQERKLRKNKT